MPDQPQPSHFKLPREQFRSVRIELHHVKDVKAVTSYEEFEKQPSLLVGTAFFYQVEGTLFLVTARHMVTGRDQHTGDHLGRYAVDPTHLKIAFRKAPPPGGWKLDEPVPASYFLLPLFDDEGKQRWREHAVHGAKMDAVVLRLSIAERDQYAIDAYLMGYGAGEEVFAKRLWPAQDVFIVGYPYGLESGFLLPLWVRGTIASEPLLMYPYRGGEMPMFLVDARTRDGQSGSPVILFAHPRTPFVREDGSLAFTGQAVSRILGVYSGRTSRESDLGFVWRIEEIDAMCRAELSESA